MSPNDSQVGVDDAADVKTLADGVIAQDILVAKGPKAMKNSNYVTF